MDDPVYLYSARAIVKNIWQPYAGTFRWGTSTFIPLANSAQPVFTSYPLAAAIKIFGESEIALHAVQSLYALLALMCFFRAATLLKLRCPGLVTALFVVSPAFLPSQNLMTDVPLISACLLCFVLLIRRPTGPGNQLDLGLASVSLGVACLIKYPAVSIVPMYLLAAFFRGKRKSLFALLIPLIMMGIWAVATYFENGVMHFLRPQFWEAGSHFGRNCVDWVVCLGALVPFSFLFLYAVPSRALGFMLVGLSVLTAVLMPATVLINESYSWPLVFGARIFWANGIFCVAGIIAILAMEFKRRHDDTNAWHIALLCVSWILGGFLFITVISRFIAVRHLLIVLPPFILLLWRQLPLHVSRFVIYSAVAITALLGITLAISDARLAEVYRESAAELARRHSDAKQIWALGDWGWQWYAQLQGMHIYTLDTALQQDDLVILPSLPVPGDFVSEQSKFLFQIDELVANSDARTWIRTMSKEPWGGFYSSYNSLPWRWERSPLEHFTVYKYLPEVTTTMTRPVSYNFADDKTNVAIVEGFNLKDSWGKWTKKQVGLVHFAEALPQKYRLTIRALAYGDNIGRPVKVHIGTFESSFTPTNAMAAYTMEIPAHEGNVRTIALESALPPVSPAQRFESRDTRPLGIGLVSIDVDPEE